MAYLQLMQVQRVFSGHIDDDMRGNCKDIRIESLISFAPGNSVTVELMDMCLEIICVRK